MVTAHFFRCGTEGRGTSQGMSYGKISTAAIQRFNNADMLINVCALKTLEHQHYDDHFSLGEGRAGLMY